MQVDCVARAVRRPQSRTHAMMKMMTPALVEESILPRFAVESLLRTPPTIQSIRAMIVKVLRRWKTRGWRMCVQGHGIVSPWLQREERLLGMMLI
jgi:hypothetical protein